MAILAVGGCGSAQAPRGAPAAENAQDFKEQLNHLVDRYWDEHMDPAGVISPQVLADSLAVERRYLSELGGISRPALDADSRLTYDIFKRRRETLIEGFTYPGELMPLTAFGAMLQSLEISSADAGRSAWSVADCENWLKRVDTYVSWTQQATQNMREGLRRGYVSPRIVISHSIELLQRVADDTASNVFRAPLGAAPASMQQRIGAAVDGRLLPANRALLAFLQHDYLGRGRASVALTDLPLGERWYAYEMKRATDSTLTADQIHAIGVAEVERLRTRLPQVHENSPSTALSTEELLNGYQGLIPQVSAAMLPLFAEPPDTPLDVRATQWLTESQTGLAYVPAGLSGRSAAILYVGTGSPSLRIAGFLQQVLPGHHLRSALAHARLDLPRFRRAEEDPAYAEGWDLYAVSLGEQLGLLTDDASKTEALALQLRCAVGLVVDTGLHAQGWTAKQALDYEQAQLGIDDAGAQSLFDSYAATPADALACEMGELRIAALRAKAQQSMGSHFDIRAFHAEILKDGAMPLDILESKVKSWMDAAR